MIAAAERQGKLSASEPRSLRCAVIGTGKISEEHLKFLSGRADVAGICDLSPALAQYAVDRFGLGRSYTDYRTMLAESRPDVVHVLTPPHTHVQIVSDCLEAGAHVICEKPIAPTNAQFRALWEKARSGGLWIVEDQNYRFNEPVLAIEQAYRQGKLGDVRDVEVRLTLNIRGPGGRYSDQNLPHPSHGLPAGVIHEFITHMCYLGQRFVPEFDRVSAAWQNHGGGIFKYDDLDALVFHGLARLRLRFSCEGAPEGFFLSVRGTRGWAETDLFQPYLRMVLPRAGGSKLGPLVNHWVNGLALMKASVRGFRNKVLQRTPYEGLGKFLSRTYAALADGGEPPVTYGDMDAASRLVDALVEQGNRI
jgi:predicted dehydrogenase